MNLVPLACEDDAYGMKQTKYPWLAKVIRME